MKAYFWMVLIFTAFKRNTWLYLSEYQIHSSVNWKHSNVILIFKLTFF